MIRGFLFDLDGVLTDTAYFQYLAWKRLATELGLHFTEQDNELLKGVTRLRSLEIILERNGKEAAYTAAEKAELIDRKNGYYRELLSEKLSRDPAGRRLREPQRRHGAGKAGSPQGI